MGEFKLDEIIGALGNPEDPVHQAMGNMETDRLKEEETRQLFLELMDFKRMKETGKIPVDYKITPELMQQLHKGVAPHLSEDEFMKVGQTFKDVLSGSKISNATPESPEAPAQAPKPTDFSGMGDAVLTALGALGGGPGYGEQARAAIESKQKMGMQGWEADQSLKAKKEQAMAAIEEKKAARDEQIRQFEARLAETQEGRLSREQQAKEAFEFRKQQARDAAEFKKMVAGMTEAQREAMMSFRKEMAGRLPPAAVDKLTSYRNTYERLDELDKLAAKNQNIFGPLEGRWSKLKVKFTKDKDRQYAINEIGSMITIAYALSGKQISYREMELLQEAMLPRIEQPYGNFKQTVAFAKDWLAREHNNLIDNYKTEGWNPQSVKLGSSKGSKSAEEEAKRFIEENKRKK